MVAVLTDGAGLKAAQGVWHIASRDLAAPRGDLAEIEDDSRRPERATMKSFPTFKARTAVLLAVTAISLLWTAPAQALTIKGSSTDVMVHLNKPKKDVDLRIRSADGRSVVPLIDAGEQSPTFRSDPPDRGIARRSATTAAT